VGAGRPHDSRRDGGATKPRAGESPATTQKSHITPHPAVSYRVTVFRTLFSTIAIRMVPYG